MAKNSTVYCLLFIVHCLLNSKYLFECPLISAYSKRFWRTKNFPNLHVTHCIQWAWLMYWFAKFANNKFKNDTYSCFLYEKRIEVYFKHVNNHNKKPQNFNFEATEHVWKGWNLFEQGLDRVSTYGRKQHIKVNPKVGCIKDSCKMDKFTVFRRSSQL